MSKSTWLLLMVVFAFLACAGTAVGALLSKYFSPEIVGILVTLVIPVSCVMMSYYCGMRAGLFSAHLD